ncbi:thioredoxin family protein [Ideonella livida]|uniref:thioredoxin family protein n=1 Tax=Ideonella livida TaxID=2707176 RepID=UPI00287314BF|nr:thioredoxin family protein [Ideonella livida]
MSSEPLPDDLLVACLCAGWCTTCDAYRPLFEALARQHPGVRFAWVDIEDHADALDEAPGGAPDIENFPTLLLSQGAGHGFFGTVLPHVGVVERLLQEAAQRRLPALGVPGLAQVVRQLVDQAPGLRC